MEGKLYTENNRKVVSLTYFVLKYREDDLENFTEKMESLG